jgi:DNA-binding response OmpR family regulator
MSIEEYLAEIEAKFAVSNPGKLRPRVLVVDQERTIAHTLAAILSHMGCLCSVSYNNVWALRKAREFKPDFVIGHVFNGDDLNGIDMAIQLRAELPETKVLLFGSQVATADIVEKAIADGHSFLDNVPILAKPVHPEVLVRWFESGGNPDALNE